MKSRNLIKITATFLLAAFTLSPVSKVSGNTSEKELGGDYHYNAIILEDYNAKDADCEGNAIIGGNLNITGYHDFGTPVVGEPADKNGPTLVVGGDIIGKAPSNVNGKIVVSSEANKEKLPGWMKDNTSIMESSVIKGKLDSIKSNLINMVEERIKGDETEVILVKDSSFKSMEVKELVKSEGKKAIVFVNCGSGYNFPNGQPMLNDGKPMDWGQEYKYWSSKIIWYFPNATEIKISEQVVGSVIAPNAVINTKSGNVNGHLLAKTLNQSGGFECHNNVFNPSEVIPPTGEVEEKFGSVKLIKIDSKDDKTKLEGAKFQLLDKNKKLISEHVTDKNGIIKIEKLEPGEYYFKEIIAPDGYVLDNKIHKFIIGTEKGETDVVLNIENVKKEEEPVPPVDPEDKLGSVTLNKIDSEDSNKKLKGAKFQLLDSNKVLISEHVTDESGIIKIEKLKLGEYYFKEVVAPDGYELDNKLHKFIIGTEKDEINIVLNIENIKKEDKPVKPVDPEDPKPPVKPVTPEKPVIKDEKPSKIPATGYTVYFGLSGLLLTVGAVLAFRKNK